MSKGEGRSKDAFPPCVAGSIKGQIDFSLDCLGRKSKGCNETDSLPLHRVNVTCLCLYEIHGELHACACARAE